MLFNTFFFCKQANIQLWQESAWWLFLFILQSSLQRSRAREKELCKRQVSSETKEGAETGLEAGPRWNSHLHWNKTPKGAGFLFMLSDCLYPKINTKTRQLLLFPASPLLALWVPLNLGLPHLLLCAAAHGAARGSSWQGAALAAKDWDNTTFHAIHLILETWVKAASYTPDNGVKQW